MYELKRYILNMHFFTETSYSLSFHCNRFSVKVFTRTKIKKKIGSSLQSDFKTNANIYDQLLVVTSNEVTSFYPSAAQYILTHVNKNLIRPPIID